LGVIMVHPSLTGTAVCASPNDRLPSVSVIGMVDILPRGCARPIDSSGSADWGVAEDRLGLEELLETMLAPLATVAGLLVPPER
jgi:hypothetical protein